MKPEKIGHTFSMATKIEKLFHPPHLLLPKKQKNDLQYNSASRFSKYHTNKITDYFIADTPLGKRWQSGVTHCIRLNFFNY